MTNYVKMFLNGIFVGIGILVVVLGGYVVMGWTTNNDGLEAESGDVLSLDKWNALVTKVDTAQSTADTALASAGGGSIPSGTVAAFKLSACPDGWLEANGTDDSLDLRGAFVRGMNGDENGRDVARSLGDYQVDTFASHLHSVNPPSTSTSSNGAHRHTIKMQNGPGGNIGPSGVNNSNLGWSATTSAVSSEGAHTHTLDIASFDSETTGDTETAPKNVVLLYCVKQ